MNNKNGKLFGADVTKFQHLPLGAIFSVVIESYKKMGQKKPVVKLGDGTLYRKVSATVSERLSDGKDCIFSFNDKVRIEGTKVVSPV